MDFSQLKILYDNDKNNEKEVECFLPVHLSKRLIETNLKKKNGTNNEQFYKWEFLNCFVNSGLCSKDFIGTEVQFPKGNKNSAALKLDAAIFDDENWFEHYENLHSKKDDSKWDELQWLKDHLLCAIEFKKEGSKDIKGVFNTQLKSYMNESTKKTVFGILYDEGRLYLFKQQGKDYYRLSDEFNIEDGKGKIIPTFDNPDAYKNLLSFNSMLNYDATTSKITDYAHRKNNELEIIAKTDSRKMNDALYHIIHQMDKCGLMNQRGYNILIQFIALKIYDERNNKDDLHFYVNPKECEFKKLSEDDVQTFIKRVDELKTKAKGQYIRILKEDNFDKKDINQVKVAIEIVKQFQNYSFSNSERSNLYQLVFYQFASQFSKADNAQFVTPLQIIDFIVDMISPKHNESIIDPTVGIADFLSVSYVKSNGKLDDNNLFGMDVDGDMVKLATLNMLLNGDGNANIEVANGLGSIATKFDETGDKIELIPATEKNKYNYNGKWDDRPEGNLKKFDIVLTNPPFGDARAWEPTSKNDLAIAECYELWNRYEQKRIDLGVIFLENAVRILKENGRMAIVLSNSIASIDAHQKARQWLMENLRIVAIIDLPAQIFAEAGVSPTIIIGYKPSDKELSKLQKDNYEVFSKEIKKVGYEVKTKNKVRCFETQYKLNPETFEKEINEDGSAKMDEEFTDTIKEFKEWCQKQENQLKKLFL